MTPPPDPFEIAGRTLLVATMHGKERAIAPVLEAQLGVRTLVAQGLDTDRFGTFSREVARTGSPLDAARAKALAALDLHPGTDLVIASEGSFGPHPFVPFLALGDELLLLIDRRNDLELVARERGLDTNYGHRLVLNVAEARAFAREAGFPDHQLVIMAASNGKPDPDTYLRKGVASWEGLEDAIGDALAGATSAWVETDMRADRNPTRMASIGRAALALADLWDSRCGACARPGFQVTERQPGLPCRACGTATELVAREVLSCADCENQETRAVVGTADPANCPWCNP